MSVVLDRPGGSHGASATVSPDQVGGRLTIQSGVPVPTFDQIGKSTLYWTPFGSRTALYSGSAWVPFTQGEIAIALSGLPFPVNHDVFLAYHPTAPFLELLPWAASGKVVTGATNATPVVITSAGHGLANGAEVYIEGVIQALEVYPHAAPNGVHLVSSAGTTFALSGSVGSFAYGRGGYFSARSVAGLLGLQDGVVVKASDHTRRYLGTIRTTAATTTEDSRVKRFVWNAFNQVQRPLTKVDFGDHTIQNVLRTPLATAYRIWQFAGATATRVEFIQGLAGQPVSIGQRWFSFGAATGHIAMVIGIDGTPRDDFMRASQQNINVNDFKIGSLDANPILQAGHHFVDIMESEVLNVQVTVGQGVTHGLLWG